MQFMLYIYIYTDVCTLYTHILYTIYHILYNVIHVCVYIYIHIYVYIWEDPAVVKIAASCRYRGEPIV